VGSLKHFQTKEQIMIKDTIYEISLQNLTEYSNAAFSVSISALMKEGYLTEEQAQEILSNYAIVVVRRGFLGKIWDRCLGLEKGQLTWRLLTYSHG